MTDEMSEKTMVDFWKWNEKAFMFAPKEAQEWLINKVSHVDVLVEVPPGKAEWKANGGSCGGNPARIYRLPTDYQPEPVGRWVECEVRPLQKHSRRLMFDHPQEGQCYLHEAPGMVGFGEVLIGDTWWPNLCWVSKGKDEKPVTLTAVRFWEEG